MLRSYRIFPLFFLLQGEPARRVDLIPYRESLKGKACWRLNIKVYKTNKLSLEAMDLFAEASEEIRFESKSPQQVYGWVERLPVQREYAQQSKAARGRVRRIIEKMTGLSRAHDYEDEYLLKTSRLWDMRSVRKSSSLGSNTGPTHIKLRAA